MRQGWEVGVWPRADSLEQGLQGSGLGHGSPGTAQLRYTPAACCLSPRTAHPFSAEGGRAVWL